MAISSGVLALVGEGTISQTAKPFEEREAGRTLAFVGWTGAAVGVCVGVVGAVFIAVE